MEKLNLLQYNNGSWRLNNTKKYKKYISSVFINCGKIFTFGGNTLKEMS
jgi:hypothetical protein